MALVTTTRMRRRSIRPSTTSCESSCPPPLLPSLTLSRHSFGYNMGGNGRWISLPLKKKKKKGGGNKKKAKAKAALLATERDPDAEDDEDAKMENGEQGSDEEEEDEGPKPWELAQMAKEEQAAAEDEDDPDDPEKTIPFARYNAMLAVQVSCLTFSCRSQADSLSPTAQHSLHVRRARLPSLRFPADHLSLSPHSYGGILESGDREWTLDDFHTLQLDKLDRFSCLKECIMFVPPRGPLTLSPHLLIPFHRK